MKFRQILALVRLYCREDCPSYRNTMRNMKESFYCIYIKVIKLYCTKRRTLLSGARHTHTRVRARSRNHGSNVGQTIKREVSTFNPTFSLPSLKIELSTIKTYPLFPGSPSEGPQSFDKIHGLPAPSPDSGNIPVWLKVRATVEVIINALNAFPS